MKIALTVILGLAAASTSAKAAVINFDSVSTAFFIDNVTDNNFVLARTDDGMATLAAGYNESYWRGNGTGRLLTFSNEGSTSGFTMSNISGDPFSLVSFDFANGYVNQDQPFASLTLTGLHAGGGTVSTTINNLSSGWTTATMPAGWTGLDSVKIVANGSVNRAVFDNIVVNGAASVPEGGSTLALLSLAAFGIGMLPRRLKG